jgi:hypothetical protein
MLLHCDGGPLPFLIQAIDVQYSFSIGQNSSIITFPIFIRFLKANDGWGERASSAMDKVGRELMLWERRTHMSVGDSEGKGRLVYPASVCWVVIGVGGLLVECEWGRVIL